MLSVDVVFLHVRRSAAAEAKIRAAAEELVDVYPTISNCRVLVELPHRHQATGKRFRVRIDISMPRREDIVVERGPAGRGVRADDITAHHKSDEVDGAFTDVNVVIHEAFTAARRRLQKLAQRRRATARARAAKTKSLGRRAARTGRQTAD
ncbi:MAG: hypothetical protein KA371_16260 [Acidobacteria bacterium]|nr:hypothetical protein [Acidobacteriota bacterium]